MRVLIDECLDWRIARSLTGHDAVSVQKMGWGGLKNGELLERAEKEFDVFLTADRNLSFQQLVIRFDLAIIVLHVESTQLKNCLHLIPQVLRILPSVKSGSVEHVAF